MVVHRVKMRGQSPLIEIVQAGGLLSLGLCLGKRREKHRRQDGDDGDDNEELDEGEGLSRFLIHNFNEFDGAS